MDPSKKNEYPGHIYPFDPSVNPFPLPTPAIHPPNFSVPPPQIHLPSISSTPSCTAADKFLPNPYHGQSVPSPYGVPPPTLARHERHRDERKYKSSYEPKRPRHSECQRPGSSSSDRYSSRHHQRDRERSRERKREHGYDRNRYNESDQRSRRSDFRKSESHGPSRPGDMNRSDRSERSSSRRSSYSPSSQLAAAPERSHRVKTESQPTERDRLLSKWRSNFCETSDDIAKKLEQLVKDEEKDCWIRSSPADLYYKRNASNEVEGTARLDALCNLFDTELIKRGELARASQPPADQEPKKRKHRVCRHKCK